MNTDLTTLRLLLATVEAGSITRGARRVNLSLAAASKRIAALEGDAGCRLLLRQARGVVATPDGEAFCAYARTVLGASMQVLDAVRRGHGGSTAPVVLLANASSVGQFLPQDLQRFLAAHPDAVIELEEHASADVVAALGRGRADLGIVEASALDPSVRHAPYRTDRLVLVVPPAHRLARRRRPLPFAEALGESFIGLNRRTAAMRRLEAEASTDARPLRLRMQVGSFDSVCRMVAAGIGAGVVPALVAAPFADGGRVATVELADAWARRQLMLVWPAHRTPSPAARQLIDHLGTAPRTDPPVRDPFDSAKARLRSARLTPGRAAA